MGGGGAGYSAWSSQMVLPFQSFVEYTTENTLVEFDGVETGRPLVSGITPFKQSPYENEL